jgi:polyvinyl alcohol dehydrogenase (cytochrome)
VQQWAPAGVSVWNTPVIDAKRQALYFGTGDSYTYPAAPTSDAILALDLRTGRLLWSYQVHPNDAYLVGCERDLTENCPAEVGKDWDIPTAAILRPLPDGGDALIVSTKPGDVLALDPDQQGKPRWRTNVAENKSGYGGMRWGGAADATAAYFGLMSGGIVAVDLATGARRWFTQLAPEGQRVGHDTPATLIDDVALLGGSDGLLYGIATRDGSRIWQFDTARDFTTVNGVAAKGGSISSAGAVAAGGMVFIGSGYMVISGKSGNVLLAFAVE